MNVQTLKCDNCGGPVFRGMTHCSYCGQELSFVDLHTENRTPDWAKVDDNLVQAKTDFEEQIDTAINERAEAVLDHPTNPSRAGWAGLGTFSFLVMVWGLYLGNLGIFLPGATGFLSAAFFLTRPN